MFGQIMMFTEISKQFCILFKTKAQDNSSSYDTVPMRVEKGELRIHIVRQQDL